MSPIVKPSPVTEVGWFQFELDSSITIGAGQLGLVLDHYDIRPKINRVGKGILGVVFLWANGGTFAATDAIVWDDYTVSLRLHNLNTAPMTVTTIRFLVILS